MKAILSFLVMLIGCLPASGQQTSPSEKQFLVAASYRQEYVMGGYVQVREWELQGDKMRLRELGMRSYPALQLKLEKRFRKNQKLALQYDQIFMQGRSIISRDIAYNGTLINGRKGIDVSPTRYFRLQGNFEVPIVNRASMGMWGLVGVVFDYVTFYFDGEVSAASVRDEVYEGFGKQAFPYPVLGLSGKLNLDAISGIGFEVLGTYIPEFKSFYKEGGSVYLQYSTFQADINYTRNIRDFALVLGVNMRSMHLFQESEEDTNLLHTLTSGPYLGVNYSF